jgi:hypothetical protein
MCDLADQAVTADPAALLRQGLDLLREGRGILTTMEPGRLDAYSSQLEDAVEYLQSATLSLHFRGMEAQGRERCLLLARGLRHQVNQFNALLDGRVRCLTAWRQIRECHEHGYTAAGAPSPAPASVRSRGEV